MCQHDALTHEPADAVLDRLNEPGVADAMLALLDDLPAVLSTMAAVRAVLARGDSVATALASAIADENERDLASA